MKRIELRYLKPGDKVKVSCKNSPFNGKIVTVLAVSDRKVKVDGGKGLYSFYSLSLITDKK